MSDSTTPSGQRTVDQPERDRPARDRTRLDERPLAGRTCVVTGASRGIGRAIATELARRGGDVVVNYHSSPDAADATLDRIEGHDGEGLTVQADVADVEAVEDMARQVHEAVGPVDVLVNNAGINVDKRFDSFEPQDWQRVLRVNLEGAFNVTSAFYEDLQAAESGRVINISSVNGERGSYGQSNYAASKTGLIGLTRSLALELAPHGTTANVVAPGYTRTDMVEGMREDIKERILDQIPADRFADPEEIAYTVCFLASDEAEYITGEVLNVNGGLYP
jgi:3-oxoacyl-[acyl-carrier protein] reductase